MGSCCGHFKFSGKVIPASCIGKDVDLPEWSAMYGRDCVNVHDMIEELYAEITRITNGIDLTSLGGRCLDYKLKTVAVVLKRMEDALCTHHGTYTANFKKTNCPDCTTPSQYTITERDVPGYPFIGKTKMEADEMAKAAVLSHGQRIVNDKPASQGCVQRDSKPIWVPQGVRCVNLHGSKKSVYVYTNANPCYTGDQVKFVEGGGLICQDTPSDPCHGKTDSPVWSDTFTTECRNGFVNKIYTNINTCYTGANQTRVEVTGDACGTPPPPDETYIGVGSKKYRKSDCPSGTEYGSVVIVNQDMLPGAPFRASSQELANKKVMQAMEAINPSSGLSNGQTVANNNGVCRIAGTLRIDVNSPCDFSSFKVIVTSRDMDENKKEEYEINSSMTEMQRTRTLPSGTYSVQVTNALCDGVTPEVILNQSIIEVRDSRMTVVVVRLKTGGGNGSCDLNISVKGTSYNPDITEQFAVPIYVEIRKNDTIITGKFIESYMTSSGIVARNANFPNMKSGTYTVIATLLFIPYTFENITVDCSSTNNYLIDIYKRTIQNTGNQIIEDVEKPSDKYSNFSITMSDTPREIVCAGEGFYDKFRSKLNPSVRGDCQNCKGYGLLRAGIDFRVTIIDELTSAIKYDIKKRVYFCRAENVGECVGDVYAENDRPVPFMRAGLPEYRKLTPGMYQIKVWVNNTDVWDKLTWCKINDFKGRTFVDGKFEIFSEGDPRNNISFSAINKTVSQG